MVWPRPPNVVLWFVRRWSSRLCEVKLSARPAASRRSDYHCHHALVFCANLGPHADRGGPPSGFSRKLCPNPTDVATYQQLLQTQRPPCFYWPLLRGFLSCIFLVTAVVQPVLLGGLPPRPLSLVPPLPAPPLPINDTPHVQNWPTFDGCGIMPLFHLPNSIAFLDESLFRELLEFLKSLNLPVLVLLEEEGGVIYGGAICVWGMRSVVSTHPCKTSNPHP